MLTDFFRPPVRCTNCSTLETELQELRTEHGINVRKRLELEQKVAILDNEIIQSQDEAAFKINTLKSVLKSTQDALDAYARKVTVLERLSDWSERLTQYQDEDEGGGM